MKKNNLFFIITVLIIIVFLSCDIPDHHKEYKYNDVEITKKDNNDDDIITGKPQIEVLDEYTTTTSIQIPIELSLKELINLITAYAKNVEYKYSGKNKIGFNVEYPYVYMKKEKIGFVTIKYPVLRWQDKKINLDCKIKVDSKITDVIFESIEGTNIQILLKVKTEASISDVELLTINLPLLNESHTIKLLSDNVLNISGTSDIIINNEISADSKNIFLNKINFIDYDMDASLFDSSTLGNFVVSLIDSDEYINLLQESCENQINTAVTEIIETKVKPYVDNIIRDIMQPISICDNSPNIWLTLNNENNKLFNFVISPIMIEGSGDSAVITTNVGIYGKPFFTIGDKPDFIPDDVSEFIFKIENFDDENFEIGLKTVVDKTKINQLILNALMSSDKIKNSNILINNFSIEIINYVPKIEIDFAEIFNEKIEIDCQMAYDFQNKQIMICSANFLEPLQNLIDNSEYKLLFNDIIEIIKNEFIIEIPEELQSLIENINSGSFQMDDSDIVVNSTINNVKILFNQSEDVSSKNFEIIFVIDGKIEPINISPLIL